MITLTTDFGYEDHYVGVMKGVILSMLHDAKIVDITHGVRRHDIRHAAYILLSIIDHFDGAVHLFVVDPGVGTSRRSIVAELDHGYYVGPDNGILTLVEERVKRVWEIKIPAKSSTFHGRDVFAPAAAYVEMNNFSRFVPVESFHKFPVQKPMIENEKIECEVIHVDHFGNVITNVPAKMLRGISCIKSGNNKLKVLESYGHTEKGTLLALINSENFLEIAVNQGDASKITGLKVGEKIKFEIC